MSRAIGELSYPLSDLGWNIHEDVVSTIELIVVSLSELSVMFCSTIDRSKVTLTCCDVEGDVRISPATLTFVVSEMGAEVLNSNTL